MLDELGDRMKHNYEEVSRTRLNRRTPVIIRIDGKAFHTFTRGFDKPFDEAFVKSMQATMKYLCENIQGCVLGYTQSDEITLVLVDYKKFTSEAWFDYQVQKMCSVAAAMATLEFNRVFPHEAKKYIDALGLTDSSKYMSECLESAYRRSINKGGIFDARCFNIPKEEVTNCILWRQKDAERNSILSVAQANLTFNEIQNKTTKQLLPMLEAKGVIWGNLPTTYKRGSCCIKEEYEETIPSLMRDGVVLSVYITAKKTRWIIDNDIPVFSEDPDYIESLIKPEEE